MPIYEYRCLRCGQEYEIMHKFSDEPLKKCPDCNGEVRRLISNTSFILKGTGWYVTDYASSERKKALESEKDTNGKKTVETTTKKGNGANPAPTGSSDGKETSAKN